MVPVPLLRAGGLFPAALPNIPFQGRLLFQKAKEKEKGDRQLFQKAKEKEKGTGNFFKRRKSSLSPFLFLLPLWVAGYGQQVNFLAGSGVVDFLFRVNQAI
jgi:hypothetical protein